MVDVRERDGRRLVGIVGAVVLTATLVLAAAVTISVPPATAAGPPALFKFLGYSNRSDGFNSEFRADFILRVNAG